MGAGISVVGEETVGGVGPVMGASLAGVGLGKVSVGIGETAVIVGAWAWRGVGAVWAGPVGLEGEKW